jgi:RNA polymerase sigma-70 factor (ECF subfamily)
MNSPLRRSCILTENDSVRVAQAMDSGLSDEEMMQRYRQGDAAAFEVLYGRHKSPMFRYLLRQCGRQDVAEELFRDVWMNLIDARERYPARVPFKTWLYHVAHERLVDHVRPQAGVPRISRTDVKALLGDLMGRAAGDAGAARSGGERLERLLSLIDTLPVAQREAFLLSEEAGLGLEDIARVTGVGTEAVRGRLHYAIERLRRGMRDI